MLFFLDGRTGKIAGRRWPVDFRKPSTSREEFWCPSPSPVEFGAEEFGRFEFLEGEHRPKLGKGGASWITKKALGIRRNSAVHVLDLASSFINKHRMFILYSHFPTRPYRSTNPKTRSFAGNVKATDELGWP